MLLLVLVVTGMAAMNALIVPLALEKQVLTHTRSAQIFLAAEACSEQEQCWAELELGDILNLSQADFDKKCPNKGIPLQK